jgi:muramoyltetrapeptide carboxypeptidase
LLLGINAKTGMVTFHGPVGNSSWGDFSMKYVKDLLLYNNKVNFIAPNKIEHKPIKITGGIASGKIMGGNLSVLSAIVGSEYLPSWDGAILFLEDTDEEPFRLDRMLTQLKLAGILDKLNGFIFGKCSACVAEEPEKAFTFEEILLQHIKPLKIPAFYNAMIGHVVDKFTIPVGAMIKMDADKGVFSLTEKALV